MLGPCHRGPPAHFVAPLSLMRSRNWGFSDCSTGFLKGCSGPRGQRTRNSVLATALGNWRLLGTRWNRTMSQRPRASRTLGLPGLSVIRQQGRLGRQLLLRPAFEDTMLAGLPWGAVPA